MADPWNRQVGRAYVRVHGVTGTCYGAEPSGVCSHFFQRAARFINRFQFVQPSGNVAPSLLFQHLLFEPFTSICWSEDS